MVLETLDKIILLVNPKREEERFQRLITHLQRRGIPFEKIAISGPTWGDELSNDLIFQYYDPFCRKGMPIFTFKARCLSKGEISLVLNFLAGAEAVVKNNLNTVLFLESDVFLREDFTERLDDLLKQLEGRDWDYVSLGEGARTRPPGCDPSFFGKTKIYDPPHQFVYRCTDSMLFRVSYLRKVLTTVVPFRECLDWELNIQHMHHKSKALWADPPLVEQGTSCHRLITHLTS
jgi:hypothetical protein